VLGFEIDHNDVMWILDQGHIAGAPSGPGDEKLIGWDLKTGKEVVRQEFSDADSDKKCSFLNDVAVDNDSGLVYISDSGIFCNPLKGGINMASELVLIQKRRLSAHAGVFVLRNPRPSLTTPAVAKSLRPWPEPKSVISGSEDGIHSVHRKRSARLLTRTRAKTEMDFKRQRFFIICKLY
jgi:hypothetical protein